MPARPAVLLRHLAAPPTDGECLRRYATARDEAAFAELVRRNGPLVLRACRSVLRDPAAADDAFQATFLTLARNASRLTHSPSVAGWLYRVAVRSAGAIRRAETRRRRREQAACVSRAQAEDLTWAEVRGAIDEEIARLPERYRAAVLLCYVQGLTYDEAARRLGCPPGALRGRLERGRAILRRRLERLGLPAVALLAAGVPAVSAELRAATVAAVLAVGPPAGNRFLMGVLAGFVVAVSTGLGLVAVGEPPAEAPKPPDDRPPVVTAPGPSTKPGLDALGDPLPPGALARMGTIRFSANNTQRVIPSADGKLVAAESLEGLRLWDGDTGRPIPLPEEVAGRRAGAKVTITPVGDGLVAVVSEKDRVRVRDLITGKELRSMPGLEPEAEGALAPDGKTWLVLRRAFDPQRSALRLWDVEKRRWTDLSEPAGGPHFIRFHFSADSRRAAVHLPDMAVEVWDLPAAKVLLRVPTPGPQNLSQQRAALSPDGKLLARLDWTAKKVRLWDVEAGKELPELPDQPKQFGPAIAWSPDGKMLATADFPTLVRVWDVSTRQKVRDIKMPSYGCSDLTFAAGGRRLAAADGDGVTVWDLKTGKPVVDYGGHTYAIWTFAWSPDGKRIASGGSYTDGVGRVWDPVTGKKLFELRGHRAGIDKVAYSPDGRLLATGSQDGMVKLWDPDTGRELHTFNPKDGRMHGLAFTPDGRHLVSGGHKSLQVWDVSGRKPVHAFPAPGAAALDVKFFPDGRRLLFRPFEAPLRVLDFPGGNEQIRWGDDGKCESAAVAPDGRSLATGHADGSIRLWDGATGKALPPLTAPLGADAGDRRVMTVAFSPDGRTVAAGYGYGPVRVFEVATGGERFRFEGHPGTPLWVAFSPDGSRLASSGGDRTLLSWDVTGSRLPSAPPPKDLAAAWADLTTEDAARGFAAVRFLADRPGECVALLGSKLKPVAAADPKAVATLIAQLGSPKFAEREKASKELAALGEAAAGPLRAAESKATSAEVRQRLAPLLAALAEVRPTGERLRAVRAVETLERVGTPEARKVLATLAEGAAGARLTEDARSALGRRRAAN